MSMGKLRFFENDVYFLRNKYPKLYKILWINTNPKFNYEDKYNMNVTYREYNDELELRKIEKEFILEIADSLTPDNSDLNGDGLKLEEIWDYA